MQGGHDVPFEYVSMQLCEKFHWTIQELNSQPWEQIELFLEMINIENQYSKREERKLENKSKSRFPK